MRFQVLAAARMKTTVFWNAVISHHPDDEGDSKNLSNVGQFQSDCMAHPRSQSSSKIFQSKLALPLLLLQTSELAV
jgi:hypothetical protein